MNDKEINTLMATEVMDKTPDERFIISKDNGYNGQCLFDKGEAESILLSQKADGEYWDDYGEECPRCCVGILEYEVFNEDIARCPRDDCSFSTEGMDDE